MVQQPDRHREEGRVRMAFLILLFLILLVSIIFVLLYFCVFKGKDPDVVVPMMQLVSYSAVGTPPSLISVKLGLALQVYVSNPNRRTFHIQDSSTATMAYGNTQVAIASLPISTSSIPSQSFLTFGVVLDMPSPISLNLSLLYSDPDVTYLSLPIATAITLFGYVATVGSFSHHSIVVSTCTVNIALGRPRTFIQSYVCDRSHPSND